MPVSQRLVVELVVDHSQGSLDLPDPLDHMGELVRCHGEGGIRSSQRTIQDEVLLYHAGAQGGGGHGDRLSQGNFLLPPLAVKILLPDTSYFISVIEAQADVFSTCFSSVIQPVLF